MTIYTATVPVRAGWTLTVDGERYEVLRRSEDRGEDRFVVEHDGEKQERHIDWFRDVTADADRVVLQRTDVPVDDEALRFSAQEFGTLLEWMMVSDPWPLESLAEDRMKAMLNEEARARGYDDWVHAYHDICAEGVTADA